MSDLWLKIKNTKDACDLGDLLWSIDESNINETTDLFPELLMHKNWAIRSDALDLIGEFKLSQFIPNILNVLSRDKNPIVLRDALIALYDIDHQSAVPILNKYISNKNISIRLAALSLLYAELKSKMHLKQISRILLRSNCNYFHKCVFFNIITDYLSFNEHPEVTELLKDVLNTTDPKLGIAKEIDAFIKDKTTKPFSGRIL